MYETNPISESISRGLHREEPMKLVEKLAHKMDEEKPQKGDALLALLILLWMGLEDSPKEIHDFMQPHIVAMTQQIALVMGDKD